MIPLLYDLLFFIAVHPITTHQSPLHFPCKPPHNTYQFCNKTLPNPIRAQSLLTHLTTLPTKLSFLSNTNPSIPSLHIPPYQWWSESLHGIAPNGPGVTFNKSVPAATMFPQVIVMAAGFDRAMWRNVACMIGVEGRSMYNVGNAGLTYWAPNVNVWRDPRWGRGQETPGEDPRVVGEFAVEYVMGFQGGGGGGRRELLLEDRGGDGRLMLSACCKHFVAYELEKWGSFSRYNFNAVDTYLPPFKSCIQDGKASCLMCSYNSVNGIPACAAGDLLKIARTQWGFQGYITSDCDAVATIFEYQHYAKSKDAVADALKAGVDINCGTYMRHNAKSALKQGKIKEKDIDRALLNLFEVQLRLGLYDGDPSTGKYGSLGPKDVCSKEHEDLALEASREGIVLLKNDKNFLPLKKKDVISVALVGYGVNRTDQLGGTYSGIPCELISYLEGVQKYMKDTSYAAGCLNISCTSSSQFDGAILIAKEADYVIVVAGLDLTQETEDLDRVTLLLPDPKISSILWVGYPGEAGGKALAEIIFGDYNPGYYQGPPVVAPPQYYAQPSPRANTGFLEGCLAALCCCFLVDECCCDPSIFCVC